MGYYEISDIQWRIFVTQPILFPEIVLLVYSILDSTTYAVFGILFSFMSDSETFISPQFLIFDHVPFALNIIFNGLLRSSITDIFLLVLSF